MIEPLEKNKRICSKCFATYVINGDQSQYWCESNNGTQSVEGLCEFCKEDIKANANSIQNKKR